MSEAPLAPDETGGPHYDPQVLLPWKGRHWKPGLSTYYDGTDEGPFKVITWNLSFILKRMLVALIITFYPHITGKAQIWTLVGLHICSVYPYVICWKYQSNLF